MKALQSGHGRQFLSGCYLLSPAPEAFFSITVLSSSSGPTTATSSQKRGSRCLGDRTPGCGVARCQGSQLAQTPPSLSFVTPETAPTPRPQDSTPCISGPFQPQVGLRGAPRLPQVCTRFSLDLALVSSSSQGPGVTGEGRSRKALGWRRDVAPAGLHGTWPAPTPAPLMVALTHRGLCIGPQGRGTCPLVPPAGRPFTPDAW